MVEVPPEPVNPGDTEHAGSTRRMEPPPVSAAQPAPQRPVRQPRPEGEAARRRPTSVPARPPGTPPPAPVYDYDPYLRRAPSRRAPAPRDSGWYLPWWSLVVMVVMVGVAAFGVLLAIGQLSEPNTLGDQPPRIEIRNPTPTLGEQFVPNTGQSPYVAPNIPPAAPTPTLALPSPIPSPSLPPGEFAIGANVEVIGVDLSGLNVRDEPGLAGDVRFRATEGDVFVLVEGPQSVDGMEWWRVEDPSDSNRSGWAARNFLTVATQ